MNHTKSSEREGKPLFEPSEKLVSIMHISALLTLMAASVIIPLLISNPSILGDSGVFVRGRYFWPKIIFFELFLLLGWTAGKPVTRKMLNIRWMIGGAAVTIWVIWNLVYGLILLLFVFSAFLPDDKLGWCVAIGVFFVAIATIFIAAAAHSGEAQLVGIKQLPEDIPSTSTLTSQLHAAEFMLPASETLSLAEIKQVRERIFYSIPSFGKIASSSNYAELAVEVRLLIELAKSQGSAERIFESCRNANILLDRVRAELSGQ